MGFDSSLVKFDSARFSWLDSSYYKCRFLRGHVEGEDTWIDIAKNREVWTDLVYELFHNAKDY